MSIETCPNCQAPYILDANYCAFCGQKRMTTPTVKELLNRKRNPSKALFLGIAVMPYFFVWFTFRKGYTKSSRVLSVLWLIVFIHLAHQF